MVLGFLDTLIELDNTGMLGFLLENDKKMLI